jgi:hypothetical protein
LLLIAVFANHTGEMSLLAQPPQLICRELPALPPSELAAVQHAFSSSAPCSLGQHWLPANEADFQPGVVRTGWHGNELLVFAELTDLDIFSTATGLNQKTWELGDAFEMFFRPVDQLAYAEFHVTPNNQRLQLRIPDEPTLRAAQKSGLVAPFLLPGEVIRSNVWIDSTAHRWSVYARIPAGAVRGKPLPLPGQQWKFSFSRYDYTRGRSEPVYSSTSPHTVLDFHQQLAWGTLQFQ